MLQSRQFILARFFMASPLFKHSAALLRKSRAEFERSAAGVLMRHGDAAMKGRPFSPAKLSKALARVKQYAGQPHRMIREAIGTEMGELTQELAKYAKDPKAATEIDKFLDALGPAGKAIKAILGPVAGGSTGSSRSMTAAINMVRSVGAEVLPNLNVKSGPEFERALEAVKRWSDAHGYELTPKQVKGFSIGKGAFDETAGRGQQPSKGRGRQRTTADVPMGSGGTKRFPLNHPVVSGEFIKAPSSTNVYSFGYDYIEGILYVRFLASSDGRRDGPGSMYSYRGVTPEEFLQLYNVRQGHSGEGGRSTPGTWVWDVLRIRGTVSGHQKDYALVGVMQQYVPRKATVHPDYGEIFVERRVKTLDGNWLRSKLPHGEAANSRLSSVIQAGNVNRGAARSGRPGAPNRGRARTGRQ